MRIQHSLVFHLQFWLTLDACKFWNKLWDHVYSRKFLFWWEHQSFMVCKLRPIPSLPHSNSVRSNSTPDWCKQKHKASSSRSSQSDGSPSAGTGHQYFSSFPSYLLLRLNFEKLWLRSGATFFCPAPTHRMKPLSWVWHCWEYWGPDHPCPGL